MRRGRASHFSCCGPPAARCEAPSRSAPIDDSPQTVRTRDRHQRNAAVCVHPPWRPSDDHSVEELSQYLQRVSNRLSNNSSVLRVSGASTTQLRHAECQVVVLLSGGHGTENRKVGGSTPPLATAFDQAKCSCPTSCPTPFVSVVVSVATQDEPSEAVGDVVAEVVGDVLVARPWRNWTSP